MPSQSRHAQVHKLELRIRDIAQLFDLMDPSPLINKDLDRKTEDFIESWAFGCPRSGHFNITIHLEQLPPDGDPSATVTQAIHNFFSYKEELTKRSLKDMLYFGRIALVIGLVFVSLCLLLADGISRLWHHAGAEIARESLTIVGWVALWRPLQTFLYDWWPLQRKIRLYERLSKSRIKVIHKA